LQPVDLIARAPDPILNLFALEQCLRSELPLDELLGRARGDVQDSGIHHERRKDHCETADDETKTLRGVSVPRSPATNCERQHRRRSSTRHDGRGWHDLACRDDQHCQDACEPACGDKDVRPRLTPGEAPRCHRNAEQQHGDPEHRRVQIDESCRERDAMPVPRTQGEMDDVDGRADERVHEKTAVGSNELRNHHPCEELDEDEWQHQSSTPLPRKATVAGKAPAFEGVRENGGRAETKKCGQEQIDPGSEKQPHESARRRRIQQWRL
jgi:hypothetical protein